MVDSLKKALSNEPVRVRVYSVAVVVLGFLLLKGVLDADSVEFIGTLLALVLGVETARSKVVPAKNVDLFTKGD